MGFALEADMYLEVVHNKLSAESIPRCTSCSQEL